MMRSILTKLSAGLVVRSRFSFSYVPEVHFQNFFKAIQKANSHSEAAKIYQRAAQTSHKYQKYLTITLRIITRLIKKHKHSSQIHFLKQFVARNRDHIVKIRLEQLELEYMKDLLIFFSKYLEFIPIVSEDLHFFLKKCLTFFLSSFQKMQFDTQKSYIPILLTSIKLSHCTCLELSRQVIKLSIQLIKKHDQTLSNYYSLQNTIFILRSIYTSSIAEHQQLALCLIEKIFQLHLKNSFSEQIFVIVYLMTARIKSQQQKQTSQLQALNLIMKKAQDILCKNLLQLDSKNIEFLITNLVKQPFKSPIVERYYQIIFQCFTAEGKAKINPFIIVYSVSLLRKKHRIFIQNPWFDGFIKMIHLYLGKGNNFRLIHLVQKFILNMLSENFLTKEQKETLYRCYMKQFPHFYEKKLSKNAIFHTIEILVHCQNGNTQAVLSILKQLQKMINIIIEEWFPNIRQDQKQQYFHIDFPRTINFVKESVNSQSQQIQKPERDVSSLEIIDNDKGKYFAQIKGKLFALQLNLAYLYHQDNLVPLFFREIKQKKVSINQAEALLKALLPNKIYPQHYSIFYNTFKYIFKAHSTVLEEQLYNILYPIISDELYCRTHTVQFLLFIQKQGNSEVIQKLLSMEHLKRKVQKLKLKSNHTEEQVIQQEVKQTIKNKPKSPFFKSRRTV